MRAELDQHSGRKRFNDPECEWYMTVPRFDLGQALGSFESNWPNDKVGKGLRTHVMIVRGTSLGRRNSLNIDLVGCALHN